MTFSISLVVDQVDTDVRTEPEAEISLEMTLHDAVPEISLDNIIIVSMIPVSSDHVESVTSTLASYSILYELSVILEELGYTSDQADEAMSAWEIAIDESVSSGQFSDNLSSNSDSTGAETLTAATVSTSQEVEYSDYAVVTVNDAHEGSTHNITTGTMLGHILFIIFMALVAGSAIVYFIYKVKKFRLKYPPREKIKRGVTNEGYQFTVRRTIFSKNVDPQSVENNRDYSGPNVVKNAMHPDNL